MGYFIFIILMAIFGLGALVRGFRNNNSKPNGECARYDEAVNNVYESTRQQSEGIFEQKEDKVPDAAKPDTKGLMFDILGQLGCQPAANDDGTISVQYQGENFFMEFGGMYARVWDPMWAGVKTDDPDMPNIRQAVNAANFEFGPTVVMTNPDDEGFIGIHSRRDIMLHPACPDNAQYVKAVLDTFFDAKERVRRNLHEINSKQTSKPPTAKDILSWHKLNLN